MLNRRRQRPAPTLPRSDMTPFVDVALLLIVFFMWLNWLQKPNMLDVSVFDKTASYCGTGGPAETLSLILLPNNRIYVFQRWQNDFGIARLQQTTYAALPRLLATLKRQNATGSTVILIEPTNQATFGNLVSVLSTVKQVGNLPYLINDRPMGFESRLVAHYNRVNFTSHPTPVSGYRQ